ncbi:MAG: guanylate kinase [Patescibacteria group bacterium]
MKRQVIVIAGPTGSGETTVTNEIVKHFSGRVKRLVTATSRLPRAGEKNGVDYYFFAKEEFARLKERGDILESTYIPNRDTYYGTYAPDLKKKIDSGYIVIVNPDIVGARYYKEKYNAVTIFIAPESIDTLERRIRERNPELSDTEIVQRRANAEEEILKEKSFYDYIVKNMDGKLDEAVHRVLDIMRKESYTLE